MGVDNKCEMLTRDDIKAAPPLPPSWAQGIGLGQRTSKIRHFSYSAHGVM